MRFAPSPPSGLPSGFGPSEAPGDQLERLAWRCPTVAGLWLNVELNGRGFPEGASKAFRGVVFAALSVEDARFGFEVLKALSILNGSVFPFSASFQIVLLSGTTAPLRRIRPATLQRCAVNF